MKQRVLLPSKGTLPSVLNEPKKNIKKKLEKNYKRDIMQLFSADATIFLIFFPMKT